MQAQQQITLHASMRTRRAEMRTKKRRRGAVWFLAAMICVCAMAYGIYMLGMAIEQEIFYRFISE